MWQVVNNLILIYTITLPQVKVEHNGGYLYLILFFSNKKMVCGSIFTVGLNLMFCFFCMFCTYCTYVFKMLLISES